MRLQNLRSELVMSERMGEAGDLGVAKKGPSFKPVEKEKEFEGLPDDYFSD